MFLPSGRAVALGLVLAGATLGPRGDEPITVELDDQHFDGVDLKLPVDPWRPLGEELVLAGRHFAVERKNGRLSIDTTGDGRANKRVTGMGATVSLRDGSGEGRPYRYRVRVERIGDGWRWSPAAARAGRVAGVHFAIVDLDGDGTFDDYGRDALVIGKAGGASFLSRVASIGGELFLFDTEEDGYHVTIQPYVGPVARVDVVSAFVAEGELVSAVFESGDISFDFASISDSGSRGRELAVPAGVYHLVAGVAEKGAETARIVPGRMLPLVLEPGDTHVLGWGGPIQGEFSVRRTGETLTVCPDVQFFGQAGEEYTAFQPTAAAPRIEVRDRKTGALLQYGTLGGLCGGGFSACVLDVPVDAELDVTLEHKRALFGKIVGRPR